MTMCEYFAIAHAIAHAAGAHLTGGADRRVRQGAFGRGATSHPVRLAFRRRPPSNRDAKSHPRQRTCQMLRLVSDARPTAFDLKYFNRITKLWNIMCKVAPPLSLGTLSSFKNFVTNHYFNLLANVFDIDQPCTWSAFIDCSCHRTHSH